MAITNAQQGLSPKIVNFVLNLFKYKKSDLVSDFVFLIKKKLARHTDNPFTLIIGAFI